MNKRFHFFISLAMTFCMAGIVPLQSRASEILATPETAQASSAALETDKVDKTAKQDVIVSYEKQLYGKKQKSNAYLGKKYEAYLIKVKNNRKTPLLIMTSNVNSSVVPGEAYSKVKHKAVAAYMQGFTPMLIAAPFTFGITLIVGLFITGPIMVATNGSYNKQVRIYLNQYPGKVPAGVLQPGEEISFGVIMPKMMNPELMMSFKDGQTDEVISFP